MASGHERYDWGANIARWVWSFALIYRSLIRALITSAALTAGVLLAGCNSDEISLANNAKANQPVPPKLVADMAEKNMDLQSPMLVRLFKQEAELEVWKQDRSGREHGRGDKRAKQRAIDQCKAPHPTGIVRAPNIAFKP